MIEQRNLAANQIVERHSLMDNALVGRPYSPVVIRFKKLIAPGNQEI